MVLTLKSLRRYSPKRGNNSHFFTRFFQFFILSLQSLSDFPTASNYNPLENIALHIEYLIQRHDCVVVPGLGAIVAIASPARYDMESDTFLPPTRSLRFNAAISHDDGMLVASIARRRSVKYQEARELLAEAVEAIHRSLRISGEVAIGRLGRLTLGKEGNLTFYPRVSAYEAMRELGLTPLRMSKEVAIPEIAPRSDKYYYIAIHKTFAKVAASIVMVLAVALSFVAWHDYQGPKAVEASVVPVEKIIKAASPERQSKKIASPDTVAASTVMDEDASLPQYHLIIGTFHTETEAQNYAATAAKICGHTLRVLPGGHLYRVALLSSDDKAQLLSVLNDGEKMKDFAGAWIWAQKK